MTANEINYGKLQEEKRHNVATERQDSIKSMAQLSQATAANATAHAARMQATTAQRSQQEQKRHNLQAESQQWTSVLGQDIANRARAAADSRNAASQERQAAAAEHQARTAAIRQATDALNAGRQITETRRHNLASESAAARSAEGAVMRGEAAKTQAKTGQYKLASDIASNVANFLLTGAKMLGG